MMTFTDAMCVVYEACPTLRMKIQAYQRSNDDTDKEILRVAMLTDVYLYVGGNDRLFEAIRTKWVRLCRLSDNLSSSTATRRPVSATRRI